MTTYITWDATCQNCGHVQEDDGSDQCHHCLGGRLKLTPVRSAYLT